MSGRISALKNKINRLQNSFGFKNITAKEKEIIFLRQEGQCKQISIDSLEYLLDKSNQNLAELDKQIKSLKDKKIKNKIKKLFNS